MLFVCVSYSNIRTYSIHFIIEYNCSYPVNCNIYTIIKYYVVFV